MTVYQQSTEENPFVDKSWWKRWRHRRYHVAIMCFLGTFSMYACRICLSVAVVAMTSTVSSMQETNFDWNSSQKSVILRTVSSMKGTNFDWNSSQKSVILSSIFYGYVPGQILAGILLKSVSPHIVFGIGTAVPGLLTVMTPVIANYLPFWVFVVNRIIMEIFQSVVFPCLKKFWTIWAPRLEVARLHGIALSGGFVGVVVGLSLSGLLADNAGWEYIFYVIGSICLLWYIFWVILIPTIGKPKETDRETKSRPIPWSSILSSLPIYGVLLAAFGWGWGNVTIITQLPMFLSDVTEFDLSKNGFLSALPHLTSTIMTILAGYIADYILVKKIVTKTKARKYFISVSLLIQTVFIASAAYVVSPIPNIICISLSIGVGAFTFSGVGVNYIDLAPAFAALVASLGNTMATLPGILIPLITGVIVHSDKSEYKQLASEWRITFFISTGIYSVDLFITEIF